MTELEKKARYNAKAKSSFKTKWNLYLFEQYLNDTLHNISAENFSEYEIKPEMVSKYTTEYWNDFNINNISTNEIARELRNWEDAHKEIVEKLKQSYISKFKTLFPEKDFNILLDITSCEYCHVTLDELNTLFEKKQIRKKNVRGGQLEIDRKDSNLEYTRANCVVACYWCNNAKTDEFNEEEFRKIGEVISNIWKQRMKK